jgi:uncharacterized SAM-binding protein YcdF (DUF218 family)
MSEILQLATAPSSVAYLLFAAGLIAAVWRRTRVVSWCLLATSGLTYTVFSSGAVAAALMSPLEYEHPLVRDPLRYPEARHIVVLSAYAANDPLMPPTGRLGVSSAFRVMLALELHRARPDCDVIVSGDPKSVRVIGEALVSLGLPADKLRLENNSHTTAESAVNLKSMLKNERFFLVTSAGHLPRSLGVLRKQGLTGAIPAPTDYQLPKNWWEADRRPTPSSLAVSDLALHERIGLIWYRLKGAI